MKIAAVLPMRHSSERVVGKNFRTLGDRPLYRHVLDTLLSVPELSEVVIDTDSPTIRGQVQDQYPSVTLVERPADLRDGNTPMNDVLLNTTSAINADLYLQTHSTNPFLRSETLSKAIGLLQRSTQADSLFGVTRLQARLWSGAGKAINHDPEVLLRTQDLEPLYLENSCVYIFDRATLLRRANRVGERPLMFEIDALEALDIDTEGDFLLAEALWKATRS